MKALSVVFMILLIISHPVFVQSKNVLSPVPVAMPGGQQGIGFDDLGFASGIGKVLVPGGGTGQLFLIDPATKEITAVEGFNVEMNYQGGHGEGTTSADEGAGFLFAIDRSAMLVDVIDPVKKQIISSATLASTPDYVRFVKETSEVWVTQPASERIEIFTFSAKPKPALSHSGFIDVPGGPESLIVDHARQRAYTHLWEGETISIDLHTHAIAGRWSNGCDGSRGIALDEKRGFLFAGCAEGKAVVLDAQHNGQQLGSLSTGSGVDVIGYNSALSHLYLSGANSATLSVVGVSDTGKLSLLAIGKTAQGAHCVTGDDQGNIWVCDPRRGQLLLYKDTFTAQ